MILRVVSGSSVQHRIPTSTHRMREAMTSENKARLQPAERMRLPVRKAARLARMLFSLPYILNNTAVRLRKDLRLMREPDRPCGLVIREMDMRDPAEIKTWLDIVNDAYDDFNGRVEDYERIILNNRHKTFFATYFTLLDDEPVGCISSGFYRDDPAKAGCARLGIVKKARGRGIGTFLLAYGFYQPSTRGARVAETEVLVKRTDSLRMHFRFGFEPLYSLPQASVIGRLLQRTANLRLRYSYWRWRRRSHA